jgi:hypothetical protein
MQSACQKKSTISNWKNHMDAQLRAFERTAKVDVRLDIDTMVHISIKPVQPIRISLCNNTMKRTDTFRRAPASV